MKYTIKQFKEEFPDDAACLNAIMHVQFGGTFIFCAKCNETRQFHAMTKRRAYACQVCGDHIYPCAGTIFHKSRTKLTDWFLAMYLMTSTRHGVAAKEIQRQLGVTYKTAWRMCHELRKLMAAADHRGPLSGHVEIDETYIGGYQSHRDRRREGSNKTAVMGLVERGGRIKAGPIPDATQSTLEPIVLANVKRDAVVSTDEHGAYSDLARSFREHGAVKHSECEWVRGIHHVNSLEGHWARLKLSIKGTHVHVSGKHLWKYVSEFSYRYNMRTSHRAMFDLLVASFSLPRLAET